MDVLKKEMEKSGGGTPVVGKVVMGEVEEDEGEEEEEEFELFSEEEEGDRGEDEEVDNFYF